MADNFSDILNINGLKKNCYYLCTIHRAENTDNTIRLDSIIKGINNLNKKYQVVLPIHPRTKKILKNLNLDDNIKIIKPVGYFDMIKLIKNSRLIITDSGGLQKEAYFFNKFCITTRDETEWIELVKDGYNKVVGADSTKIIESVKFFDSIKFNKVNELYGGGNASINIVNKMIKHFYSK